MMLLLKIEGYHLERVDHQLNVKRGGACVYYKEHLPLKIRKDLCKLNECFLCKLRVGNKKCFLSGLYRSSSQSTDEFLTFKQSL